MSTRTRFEKGAKGNSEMAYSATEMEGVLQCLKKDILVRQRREILPPFFLAFLFVSSYSNIACAVDPNLIIGNNVGR